MKHVLRFGNNQVIEVIAVNPGVVLIDSAPGRIPEAVAEIAPDALPLLIEALQAIHTELEGHQ
ncbi:hypothetical protein [Kocuria sp.]|uniref:hypothetical protein n=1 Tax=Kocuria sp. TaxID=1871328 RepID=UPI0026DF06D7|nr:hypothetical protein [Kocuria sp.]MDO5619298.1 hypothetical protein [Kocuria sp.]